MSNRLNQNVSVDCVVFSYGQKALNVLLIQQNDTVSNPQYALPGDLVLEDENLDGAATRILKDLTGVDGIYLKQFHAFGNPDRLKYMKDQEWLRTFRQNPESRVITVGYYSLVNEEDFELKASSFAGKAEWVNIKSIPELAFDHNQILERALRYLREELHIKHVEFELLPEKFTMAELQNLYEIILEKKFDKRNFRKTMKNLDHIEATNEVQSDVSHRPAKLYAFKEGHKKSLKKTKF